MDFDQAWKTMDVGDQVKISNGRPPPSMNKQGKPFKAWRSHNFTGTIKQKIDGEWRSMVIMMDPDENGNQVGYTVQEGIGHVFTPA